MGRKAVKSRPAQGDRLHQLRLAAGLTQSELAEMVGTIHSNIAFWEKSDKPPRSDVLPKLAQALGVSVEQLLSTDITKPRTGPAGKLRVAFENAAKLPRSQQDRVVEVVNALVRGMDAKSP
jgi:transcriptional regulator with XRE-family HTH domain